MNIPMQRPYCTACIGLGLLVISTFSMADTEHMNATLQRIQSILKHINPLINQAEAEQNPNARVQFQFNALRQDISHVQEGITEAIKGVSIQPRQVIPLLGDYLPMLPAIVSHNKFKVQS